MQPPTLFEWFVAAHGAYAAARQCADGGGGGGPPHAAAFAAWRRF
eukprot:gene5240-4263_t